MCLLLEEFQVHGRGVFKLIDKQLMELVLSKVETAFEDDFITLLTLLYIP